MVETIETSCSGVTPISCPMEIAPIETFDQRFSGLVRPRVSPGNFDTGLLPETKGANVFVEPFFTQAQRNLDGSHVARFRQNTSYRKQPVRLAVADAHAIDDDRSHLAVKHFVGTGQFFFERRRNRDQLEG